MSKMLSVKTVAERLEVHDNTIRRYIKTGELPAVKLHTVWRVAEEDLNRFIEERKQGVKR